jgi:protein kinase X
VIACRGHGFPVDWWALGILLYELLNGFPPFCANDPVQVYALVLRNKPEPTPHMPPAARQLCAGLLQTEPHARLGGRRGALELMLTPLFAHVDWLAVACRAAPAPVLPIVPPADPVELSDIEALLQPGYASGGADCEDAFTSAAAARHLFAHDFMPCEEPAGGKRAGAADSPETSRMLAKRLPKL